MKYAKYVVGLAAIVVTAGMLSAADSQPATFLGKDKVAEALLKGGVLTATAEYKVQGGHRTTPSMVEVHQKETDVIYVTEGEVTYVTGGTMIGGSETAPNELRGTDIKGGQSHHMVKGDVIVVPAGTPHWSKEVPSSVSYYIVKILKP
jgi:hypothetical protein